MATGRQVIAWLDEKDPWFHNWADCCDMADGERHEWGRPPPNAPTRTDAEALAKTAEILHAPLPAPIDRPWCSCRECREARAAAQGAA